MRRASAERTTKPLAPALDSAAAAEALRDLLGADRYFELELERPIELFRSIRG